MLQVTSIYGKTLVYTPRYGLKTQITKETSTPKTKIIIMSTSLYHLIVIPNQGKQTYLDPHVKGNTSSLTEVSLGSFNITRTLFPVSYHDRLKLDIQYQRTIRTLSWSMLSFPLVGAAQAGLEVTSDGGIKVDISPESEKGSA